MYSLEEYRHFSHLVFLWTNYLGGSPSVPKKTQKVWQKTLVTLSAGAQKWS